MSDIKVNSRVVLSGLKTEILNGAVATVVGACDNGRWPVKIVSPPEAKAKYTDTVKCACAGRDHVHTSRRAQREPSKFTRCASRLCAHTPQGQG